MSTRVPLSISKTIPIWRLGVAWGQAILNIALKPPRITDAKEHAINRLISKKLQTVRVRSLEGYLERKGPQLILDLSLV